jgi:hypothetical protein
VLFMALTLALYHVLTWLDVWLGPQDKYREPQTQAVKAFVHATVPTENGTMSDRLRLFYWYGE